MVVYLVGFKCYLNASNIGCECNIDVPEDVKREFEEKNGFPYDEYCLYDIVCADDEIEALELAYSQCGAAEEETIRENFPEVEVICKI